jgi:hypothetical protein
MATTKRGADRSEEDLAIPKNGAGRELAEDEIDAEIALATLADIEQDPTQILSGEALEKALKEIVG